MNNIIDKANKFKELKNKILKKNEVSKNSIDEQWDIFSNINFTVSNKDSIYIVDNEYLSSIKEHVEQIIEKKICNSTYDITKLTLNEYETLVNYYQESYYFAKSYYEKFSYRIGILKTDLAYGKLDDAMHLSNLINNEIIYLEKISKKKAREILNINNILRTLILIYKFTDFQIEVKKSLQPAQKLINNIEDEYLSCESIQLKEKIQFYLNQYFDGNIEIKISASKKRKLVNILKKAVIIETSIINNNHYYLYFTNTNIINVANDFFNNLVDTNVIELDIKNKKIFLITTNKTIKETIDLQVKEIKDNHPNLFEFTNKKDIKCKTDFYYLIDNINNLDETDNQNCNLNCKINFDKNEYIASQFYNIISKRQDCSDILYNFNDLISIEFITSNHLILKNIEEFKANKENLTNNVIAQNNPQKEDNILTKILLKTNNFIVNIFDFNYKNIR